MTNQKDITFKKLIPGLAWFFLICFLMCLPGKDIPQIGWLDSIHFDKMVHAGSFMVMTILFSWPFLNSSYSPRDRRNYFIKIAIATSLWGLTIEFIQKFYIPNRDYELADWAADSFGSIVGLIISNKLFLKDRNPNAYP